MLAECGGTLNANFRPIRASHGGPLSGSELVPARACNRIVRIIVCVAVTQDALQKARPGEDDWKKDCDRSKCHKVSKAPAAENGGALIKLKQQKNSG